MRRIQALTSFEQIKSLADARRMRILRMLMAAPATLSQLAETLRRSPAWVRHHVQKLEAAGLIELDRVRTAGSATEKYYRARSGALLLQELILPEGGRPVIVFSGSHDLALELIGARIAGHLTVLTLPVGSLDGLANLRQGLCQLSGAHLLGEDGAYNATFVRHLFPDRAMTLVTLAHRTQGLMLAPGNPKGVRGLADLARGDLRFINRNPGSGTRLWLDGELGRMGLAAESIVGYGSAVNTHTTCAHAVASGQADAALGLQAAACLQGLEFIPLFQERYDLVLLRELEDRLAPLLDRLCTAEFRAEASALTGYETSHSGEQIAL